MGFVLRYHVLAPFVYNCMYAYVHMHIYKSPTIGLLPIGYISLCDDDRHIVCDRVVYFGQRMHVCDDVISI